MNLGVCLTRQIIFYKLDLEHSSLSDCNGARTSLVCRIISSVFRFDATSSHWFGKFVNDGSASFANARMIPTDVDGSPHLFLFADLCGIPPGTELRYEYWLVFH